MTVPVALHVHSTWSDGEMPLDEVVALLADAGARVIFMSDHSDTFDEAKSRDYVAACARCSTDRVLVVAGLEYTARDRMHILGYGATAPCGSDDPATIIAHIRDQGGVAVIAHPSDRHFSLIEALSPPPDGIECWNTKYDGPFAPRPAVFALLARVRAHAASQRVFASYGYDLHWRTQARPIHVEIPESTPGEVVADPVAALGRSGSVARHAQWGMFSPDDLPADTLLATITRERAKRDRLLLPLRTVKRAVGKYVKWMIPSALVARLRRLIPT